MKILMTADTVGGVWTYALELSRALAREGVEVALATKGALLTPDQRAEVSALPNVELFESAFKLEWMQDPWADVERASQWLLELAAKVRPDVVHLNDYAHGALRFGAPALVVAHSCVLSWWAAVRRTQLPDEWSRYRREVTLGVHSAGMVVAPSRSMLQALARHYGPLRDGRVIYNGRTAPQQAPVDKESMVLAAGRLWDEAKNVAALEAIASRLPWPVYLAGESGAPTERLPGVHRLGRLSSAALAGWFARASIYALPARYEPFGLSVLEAAQAGCALVLGDIDSLRELWNGAATFVPPDDPEALWVALCRLMANPAERQALAARAKERSLALTPERMASQYAALYRELRLRGARSLTRTEVQSCAS